MARVISQAVDELENIYSLKDDGTLEKTTSTGSSIWVQQTKQEPTTGQFVFANAISLDLNNDIWLTYSDTLNITVRSTSTGLQTNEVLGTPSDVIVAQAGGVKMFSISTSRGLLHEIDRSTFTLIRDFDLTEVVPDFNKDLFMSQMTSGLSKKVYFGALIGPVGEAKTASLVQFDASGNGEFTCVPLTEVDVLIPAVGADVTGNVYAATLHGSIYRFSESLETFDAMFEPTSPCGVINTVTFTETNDIVLIDDGTFAEAGSKTRIIDPENGTTLSTVASTNIGTTQGDPLGYQHVKLTRIDVPPAPIVPVVDSGKLDIFVKPDGTVTATGRPGAVQDTDLIDLSITIGPVLIGSTTPNSDGSFSITTAPGTGSPSGEGMTFAFIKGAQQVSVVTTSVPRALPGGFSVQFRTPDIVFAGTSVRLKAKLFDSGSMVITPSPGVFPIFRLKEDASGKWFNGNMFVADNGDYLQGVFDADSEFWFVDVAIPVPITTSLTLIIKDSPPFGHSILAGPEIATKEELADAVVDALKDEVSSVLTAPAGSFTDPNTVGGFLFNKINDIQKKSTRLLSGIAGSRLFCVESILTDVDKQSVPSGSTPTIEIIVFDEDRRFRVDITGATVTFKAKVNLDSDITVINRVAEIIDGPQGVAQVQLTEADTDTVQKLTAQVVAEIPGTGTLIGQAITFDITQSVL